MRHFSSFTFRNCHVAHLGALLRRFVHRLPALSALCGRWVFSVAARTLAPLRKIMSRELEVSEPRPKYVYYSLIDSLECGHRAWSPVDLADLLNAYTESPVIRARRHRCQPCARLLAERKPVQTVTAVPLAAKTA